MHIRPAPRKRAEEHAPAPNVYAMAPSVFDEPRVLLYDHREQPIIRASGFLFRYTRTR